MDDEIFVTRRNAVIRIARKLGFDYGRCEEIGQEACAMLIENPKRISQNGYQAFIDAVRKNGIGNYNRSGRIIRDILPRTEIEYAHLTNELRCESDAEDREEHRKRFFDFVFSFTCLKKRYQMIFLMAVYGGFSFREISYEFGVSESRIAQIVTLSQEQIKKKIISKSLSLEKQRIRKQKEYRQIPQNETFNENKKVSSLPRLSFENGERVGSFKIQKIPQEIFRTFRVNAF